MTQGEIMVTFKTVSERYAVTEAQNETINGTEVLA